jgi:DNA-binding transcriptional MocR family regulator
MRDIERATATYTARRTALVEALRDHGLTASGRSGMNVWVPVADEQAALARLLEDGWGAAAGARYRLRTPPAVRITIARMAVEEAERVAGALAAAAPLTSRTRST